MSKNVSVALEVPLSVCIQKLILDWPRTNVIKVTRMEFSENLRVFITGDPKCHQHFILVNNI